MIRDPDRLAQREVAGAPLLPVILGPALAYRAAASSRISRARWTAEERSLTWSLA